MRLTPPTPLHPDNVALDSYDLAQQSLRNSSSSQLAFLRWGAVSDADMLDYLVKTYSRQIPDDSRTPRISSAKEDGKGDDIERREHLVIRDLDILPYLVEQNPHDYAPDSDARKLGRIVAHADYRFRPKGWSRQGLDHAHLEAESAPLAIPKPPRAKVELIDLFEEKVEELLDHHCKSHDCYELVDISTNPSHLRKGLAKQLVTWLLRFCDEQQLDYKLLASPIGRALYQSCGFVEEGEGDTAAVEIDMAMWGGEGLHQHVYMVRHPA